MFFYETSENHVKNVKGIQFMKSSIVNTKDRPTSSNPATGVFHVLPYHHGTPAPAK